jgi:hypothetical protein
VRYFERAATSAPSIRRGTVSLISAPAFSVRPGAAKGVRLMLAARISWRRKLKYRRRGVIEPSRLAISQSAYGDQAGRFLSAPARSLGFLPTLLFPSAAVPVTRR